MPQLFAMNEPSPTDPSPPRDGDDLAPRPRPGFRSRAPDSYDKARLFAGATRAVLGCAGFFASLLYFPIVIATPVLAGVSTLMMVTGSVSVWRALHDAPALKGVWRAVVGLCVLVSAATVLATIVLGAGALGPLSQGMQSAPPDDGAVRFEMQP